MAYRLEALRNDNLVFVLRYDPPPVQGRWSAVYAVRDTGQERDAIEPKVLGKPRSLKEKKVKVKKEQVLDVLRTLGKMTRAEIEEHFGAHYTMAKAHLRDLRLESAVVIADWRLHNQVRRWAPVYAAKVLPDQVDAPEPVTASLIRLRRPPDESTRDPLPQRIVQERGVAPEHVEIAQRSALAGSPWVGL